ncbi:YkgJ family cysteine cluster protein [Natrialbaceae archaeon A-arb3/5]
MQSLEAELERARTLSVDELADAIESIGFECTRCGACCTGHGDEEHTATVFPDEVRELTDADTGSTADDDRSDDSSTADRKWRDVARPMPYGLEETGDEPHGETFEWALQTDGCGDCVFYEEDETGTGACVAHEDRPLICRTYPFSVALAGTSQPMGEAVDSVSLGAQPDADSEDGDANGGDGVVRAHECEGLGRDISRQDAEELAGALKERAIRELEEAIAVRDEYEPATPGPGEVVVHDSEGTKRIDGTPIDDA